jgi:NAD(P)H-dependent FMN reductase
MTDKPRIGIIISTTRATRFADKPTEWFLDIASKRSDVEFEIVDLRDYPMPFFEEPASPAFAPVSNDVARRWQEKIASLDGYVFVVAEYNHSISGVLKNALDFAYREFNRKPATFIGYGGAGAARAIEHLRGILGELQVADLKYVVSIGMLEYIGIAREGKSFADFPYLADSTKPMLDDLVWWANALREAREELREAA